VTGGLHSIRNFYRESQSLPAALQTQYIGRKITWVRSLPSTQGFAKDLVSAYGVSRLGGYVVIADTQKSGTGRHGNKWVSPQGGIWLSIILGSTLHPSKCILFSLCASLAVSEAINKCTGLDSKLKWPNDVLIKGKKVSGVLVDVSVNSDFIEHVIIGIGVNVNIKSAEIQRDIDGRLPYPITSIKEELAVSCDKVELIKSILRTLDRHYFEIETDSSYPLLEKWKQMAEPTISKSVQVSHGTRVYTAKVVGLEEDGSLVIAREDNKIERIVSAEYSIRVIE
jgi:BirA family transcriptional regulator, biotin operon repressor / biotin---[acetyl-CoA-carboxylase] ligase